MGFHDQLLGLKWVHENIAAFGGDANLITIFGASAGSFSIGSIVLSPLSKNLFRRAIMQSGAPNTPLGGVPKKVALERSVAFAKRAGCTTTEPIQSAIDCLKGKTVEQLMAAEKSDLLHMDLFTPMYGDEFTPIAPVLALKEGKLPNRNIDLMVGGCQNEGSGFVLTMFPQLRSGNTTLQATREQLLYIARLYNISTPQEVADFYLQGLNANSTQDQLMYEILFRNY